MTHHALILKVEDTVRYSNFVSIGMPVYAGCCALDCVRVPKYGQALGRRRLCRSIDCITFKVLFVNVNGIVLLDTIFNDCAETLDLASKFGILSGTREYANHREKRFLLRLHTSRPHSLNDHQNKQKKSQRKAPPYLVGFFQVTLDLVGLCAVDVLRPATLEMLHALVSVDNSKSVDLQIMSGTRNTKQNDNLTFGTDCPYRTLLENRETRIPRGKRVDALLTLGLSCSSTDIGS